MLVAIAYGGFYGGRGEGVVQHITQLQRTLPDFGFRAAVLSLESIPPPARFLPHAVQYGVGFVAPSLGHYWRLALGRRLMRGAFERLRWTDPPRAVIFEDIYLPFRCDVPALVMLHALPSDNMQQFDLSEAALRGAQRRDAEALLRCKYPVAVVSEAYRDHVVSVVRDVVGATPDLDVLPLGVDIDQFPDPPEPRPNGDLRLIFVGYLEPRKNVLFLASVMEELRRRYGGPVQLTVVGDGPQRAALDGVVQKRGLASSVRLLGRLPRSAVASVLRSQHLMLHPSLKESFSQTLLEGKLAGLRTLATAGLEVPAEFIDVRLPLEPGAWAEAIAELAPAVISASADAARVGELQRLRARYSRQAMVERTLRKLLPS